MLLQRYASGQRFEAPLAEILMNCKAETGLEPPSKPAMSKLVLKKRVA